MSRGKKLQEMEVKTQQSRTAVNAGAKPGDPMPKMADPGTQLGRCRGSRWSYSRKLQT